MLHWEPERDYVSLFPGDEQIQQLFNINEALMHNLAHGPQTHTLEDEASAAHALTELNSHVGYKTLSL